MFGHTEVLGGVKTYGAYRLRDIKMYGVYRYMGSVWDLKACSFIGEYGHF